MKGFKKKKLLKSISWSMSFNLKYSRITLVFNNFVRSRTIGDPSITIEVEDSFRIMIYTKIWVDFSYPTLMGHLNELPNIG